MSSFQILEKKELTPILELLSDERIALNDAYKKYTSLAKDNSMRVCCGISMLLDINLLSLTQRFVAMYLIIKTYGDQVNPFFAIVENVLKNTRCNYEKRFISEQILGLNKQKWGEKSTSEMLVEEKEATQEYTIPNEVNNMLMLFKKNIEEVDQEGFGQDRVNRIVPEYKLFNEELNLPTDNIKITDIDNLDLKIQTYTPNMLSVLPEQIPVDKDEFCWIMPLAMDDVMWNHEKDNKALEESLKNLIEMASKDTLPPNQVKYTLELVNQNIDFLTGENNILLDNIAGIVEKNSYIITAIMVQVSNEKEEFFKKCLTYFIEKVEQNVHSLEVVFNLIKHIKLPEKFLTCYIFEWFKSCQKLSNDPTKQNRKLKLVTKFVSHLLEKKIYDPSECYEYWINFCSEFSSHKCAKDLSVLLQEACTNRDSKDSNKKSKQQ